MPVCLPYKKFSLSLGRRDADGIGPAGANPASDRLKILVEAHLEGGQVIVAAAQRHGRLGNLWIAGREERQNLIRRHGDLRLEAGKPGRNSHRLEGLSRGREV